MRYPLTLAACLAACVAIPTHAANATASHGTWVRGAPGALLELKACADAAGVLCGQIVWDKDAGTAADACGVRIARLKRWDGEAWREGWVHDPRSKKNYKGVLRAQGDKLSLRAFVGVEVLGETEEMTRAAAPAQPCPQR